MILVKDEGEIAKKTKITAHPAGRKNERAFPWEKNECRIPEWCCTGYNVSYKFPIVYKEKKH